MIVDLNLKVPSLKENMICFKQNANHYIVKFSDDGAPESGERTIKKTTFRKSIDEKKSKKTKHKL